MDTIYPLYYNGPAVSQIKVRQHGQERFTSEIMTYLDHLYRVAFHLARNDDEAQDCVQETCARALGAYGQFAPGSNMKAWLTRILYNLFFDSYARNKRMVAAEDIGKFNDDGAAARNFFDSLTMDQPGPETQILQQELGAKIGAALKRIPEEFRAPIVLVDMGDLSYAEAAEILSCPIGTVRSRLSRGRKLLHQLLSAYLDNRGVES